VKINVVLDPFDLCPPGLLDGMAKAIQVIANGYGFRPAIGVDREQESDAVQRFFEWQANGGSRSAD